MQGQIELNEFHQEILKPIKHFNLSLIGSTSNVFLGLNHCISLSNESKKKKKQKKIFFN